MLKDKIVWITGAGSGIGAETAKQLASRGAVPILTGRNEERLRRTAAEIGAGCGVYRLDVTDNGQVQDVARRIQADFGPVDVLVNNAGFGIFEMFRDAPLDHIESMMDTNYMGMVRCTKAVLPSFLARREGHIVNIASIAGKFATPKSTGYTASKHAVLGFTNALRLELRGTGIAVSAVNPGPIDTPFFEIADPDGHYVRNVRRFMLKPEKVAAKIVKVIETRKAEVDLPLAAAFGVKLYHMFPRIGDKIAGTWLNRK
ncbi:MAG: oxidoreductase [Thermobacillus sp.]|uniref:Short-chain dehydrogenase/reductase SDR, putative oxidoreductase YqjQ n=1 Tax=Thermobacillus xylanilyticus TaxID=76633 RepID=A0ABN7S6L3_THEXY|nr:MULTISPECIES: SDR family oxidoreductase [Thermobacillus]REK55300.1 MAG: oxidoreductase [Thermobacillus sp.]CAG5090658.1 Short-chain dehydrogenase/reductase SDR, putative oxidoreductase YqjQ [Thermobacillus xylanilyticus]